MGARKKFVIFFCSTLCCFGLGILIDLACGPEPDPYDYYASFFHNTIQENDNYRSFYFNGYLFLNNDENPVSEKDINSIEWAQQFKRKVSTKDVEIALYGLDEKTDSVLLLKYLKPNGKLPDPLKSNSFFKQLVTGRNNEALQYYCFAKKTEHLLSYDNLWNPKKIENKLLITKAGEALLYAGRVKSPFFKLRYYYQGQRLTHYAGKFKEAAAIYEQHIKNTKSKSHVACWALSLNAGEEQKMGNPAKAAYLFSKLFANYPERRIQAFHDFNNTAAPPENILNFTKNADEKAFLYAIRGFHTSGVSLKALEAVYDCQPKSPLIKLLLVREINKIEEGYLSAKLDKTALHNPYSFLTPDIGPDSIVKKQKAYFPKLKAFCKRLANEGRYAEPALGNIAVGYLAWMQGDNTGGLKIIDAVNRKKISRKLEDQRQLIKLLLLAQKIKALDTMSEKELLPSLSWLSKKVKQEIAIRNPDTNRYYGAYDLKYYSASARDFYALVLTPAYLKQKDTAMAALAMLKSYQLVKRDTRYSEIAMGFNMPDFLQRKLHSYHLNKLIRLVNNPEKTAYVKLLCSEVTRGTRHNLYDLLGTAYLREHNYSKAVRAFSKIPDKKVKHVIFAYWDRKNECHRDPFVVTLADTLNTVYTKGYNKLTFAKRMAHLQKLIKNNPKNAGKYYYLMANGLYNTSYAGNAWFLIAYTNMRHDRERKPVEYYDADFLAAANAEKYYKKAAMASSNPEFKARCVFMAAKCGKRQILIPGNYPVYSSGRKYEIDSDNADIRDYDKAMRNNPYFSTLKNNYSNTKFYKLAVHECSYFRDYLASSSTKKKDTKSPDKSAGK